MKPKRLDYLDMVKGFGIFLVVLGHMEDISTATRVWISSFHMPLFFVVSGLLMAVKREDERDFSETVKRKWKGILIPYLWFSLSYFLIDILNVTVIANIDLRTFIVDTISSVTFYGMSVLWFLPALFIAEIGFLFIKKHCSDKITAILLAVVAIAFYIGKLFTMRLYDAFSDSLVITSLINIVYIFERAAVAMVFVGYAFYIRKLYEKLLSVTKDGKRVYSVLENKWFGLIFGIVMLGLNIVLAMRNECVDLRNIILNNVAVYFAAAFIGSYAIILICRALPTSKIVTYFGRNSIIVMAAHVNYYFLYAGLRLAWVIIPHVSRAKHYVFVTIVVITIFVLCTIVIEVINRFFPFVLGKPFRIPWRRNKE